MRRPARRGKSGARAASRAPSFCSRFAALLFVLAGTHAAPLAAQDTTTALFDRAASIYAAAGTVRATFEQTLANPVAGKPERSRGEYVQGDSSRFAVRFTQPSGDAIVDDGTWLWLYLPSSARGQVIKMPGRQAGGMDFLAVLLSAPRADYIVRRVRQETVNAHPTTVFSLLPRSGDLPFARATLWIGTTDGLIWQLETSEQTGLVRHVRFTSVQTGVGVPADAFTFTVPPGVKVLDQDALFGKKP